MNDYGPFKSAFRKAKNALRKQKVLMTTFDKKMLKVLFGFQVLFPKKKKHLDFINNWSTSMSIGFQIVVYKFSFSSIILLINVLMSSSVVEGNIAKLAHNL